MDFNSVNLRIVNWNSARYEQEFNEQLQYDLLFSPKSGEIQEWANAFAANDKIEQLDALADIYFVAVGGLWKLGFTIPQMAQLIQSHLTLGEEATFVPALNYWRQGKYEQAFGHAIVTTMHLAMSMGLSGLQYLQAISAVCDSNDTKPVVKTASDVKANVDKGATYVPPTKALEAILSGVRYV